MLKLHTYVAEGATYCTEELTATAHERLCCYCCCYEKAERADALL
jgi:hypothetical protein